MEKFGEFLLEARSGDILECFNNIAEEDIEACCDYKIYNRGLDYYHEGMVEHIVFNKNTGTISSSVNGTREYNVEIFITGDEIHGSCTCEYPDVCKHIIAVLLQIAEEGIDEIPVNNSIQVNSASNTDYIKDHLKKLTKDELINLIIRFAPDNFFNQIQNSHSNVPDAYKLFTNIENKINGFFNDTELLWDPSGMESALMKQLDKLKGLENQLPEEIGKLILSIMEKVNDAFDEGYLYIDNYYEDDYFESAEFAQYTISFIKQLNFDDKLDYLKKLNTTLDQMSYDTFEEIHRMYSLCFSEEETNLLKDHILSDDNKLPEPIISSLYCLIEPKLNILEKEVLLMELAPTDSKHFISLLETLIEQNKIEIAYDKACQYLRDHNGFIEDKILELYLDLTLKLEKDINHAALIVVNHNPTVKSLLKTIQCGVSDTEKLESILNAKNKEELLHFYEKVERLGDALDLIEKNQLGDYTLFSFFKKNKKNVAPQAERFFVARIEENLKSTGDNFYCTIAETLSQLAQINAILANKIVADIRLNYKRRTKLMTIISKF